MRIAIWVFGILTAFSLCISLILLIPSVQQFATDKATDYISEKTGTEVTVGNIHISFPKTIKIGGIYIADAENDTLFYCDEIALNVAFLPLIRKSVHADYVKIDGISTHVYRQNDSTFNFSPLLTAFSAKKASPKVKTDNEWKISLDELQLSNITADYISFADSTSFKLNLGQLTVIANSVDLLRNKFDILEVVLSNTMVQIVTGKKGTGNSDNKSTSLPDLSLHKLSMENFEFSLKTTQGDFDLSAQIKEAKLQSEKIDLPNHDIRLNRLFADGANIALKTLSADSGFHKSEVKDFEMLQNSGHTFGNINWKIFIENAELGNSEYTMDLDNNPPKTSGMDYNHMALSGISFRADSLFFNRDSAGFLARNFSVKDISGPKVDNFSGQFFMDNNHISGKQIKLQTPFSRIEGTVYLGYPGLNEIGKKTDSLEFRSDLSGNISTSDVQPFYPLPDTFPAIKNIPEIRVNKIITSGYLNDFQLEKVSLSVGDSTGLAAEMKITGLFNGKLEYDYSLDTLFVTRTFLQKIGTRELLNSSYQLPPVIRLKSQGNKDADLLTLKADMWSELGRIQAEANLDKVSIEGKILSLRFDVGNLFQNDALGEINLKSNIKGTLTENSLDAFTSITEVFTFEFNDNTISNTKIELSLRDGTYYIDSKLADPNIIGAIKGFAQLKDSSNHFELQINSDHVDLASILPDTGNDFVIAGNMLINADYSPGESLFGKFESNRLSLKKNDEIFAVNQINLEADIRESYTNFNLDSDIIDASLSGNTNIFDLKTAFINHLNNYLSLPDSLLNEKDYNFDFDLQLKKPEFFTDFLIDDLHELSIEQCHAKYNRKNDLLEADIKIPKLVYGKFDFNDLILKINSKTDSTVSSLWLAQITYDSAYMKNINLKAKFEKQAAVLSLIIRDAEDSLKYRLASDLIFQDSVYYFTINPKGSVIDYLPWQIDPDNSLKISKDKFIAENAVMSFEDQKVWLETDEDTVRLNLENVKIQNITGLLEKEKSERILKGRLNGSLKAGSVFSDLFLSGKMLINELSLHENPLGKLTADFNYKSSEKTDFSVMLKNDINLISAVGEFSKRKEIPYLNVNMESDITDSKIFASLVDEYIKDLSGGLTGRLAAFGPVASPTVNGNLSFNKLNLTVKSFNTRMKTNGNLIVDNNIVQFNNFNVRDSIDNNLAITGTINVGEISNPDFNLHISSKDFTVVNTHSQTEKKFLGKLLLGAEIDIIGKQTALVVKSNISVNEGTDIMYIFPGKDLELITDEGIVDFVDFDNPVFEHEEAAKNKFIADSIASTIKGIDLTIALNVNPKAKFRLYIDPKSGDITYFRLRGNLKYQYNDVRRGYLTGRLELAEGYYDLSFYGLVKKRFDFDPGSSVSWSGDVMNGDINLTAKYIVETNSVGLVSNEISTYEKSMYNQRLPYEVLLYIKDRISNPQISFGIELPSRYRAVQPIIDAKLKSLNSDGMESERNKQVFALLVGGTFIPENPGINDSGSDRNFATTAAINSINSIFTQQLNNLTGQFIKVVDLDMGVNTFDDYSTGKTQTRTQLDLKVSKQLFNDRVSAEVESHIDLEGNNTQPGQQSTMGLPEFAVTYNLTEKGNYRVKAFRENYYDMYDGEISNSGVAFIFIRDFDSFSKKDNPGKSGSEGKKPKNK